MNENTKGKIALIASAIIWGVGYLFVRLLYNAGYSVPTFVFFNMFFAAIAFFFIIKYKKIKLIPEKNDFKWLLINGVANVVTALTVIWAFVLTKIAVVEFLHYTMPLWAFLIAVFWLKEKITKWKFFALVLAITGIFLVFDLNSFRNGFDLANLGAILALISAVSYALTINLGRKVKNTSEYLTSFWMMFVGSFILFFFFIFDNTLKSWYDFPIFFVYGLATSVIPLILFFYGLRKVEATTSSILMLIEVPLASLWAFLLFKEGLTPLNLFGGILILISAVILLKKQTKNSSKTNDSSF